MNRVNIKKLNYNSCCNITPILASGTSTQESPVRRMEYLTRGLVTMETAEGMYMSWRFLGNDPDEVTFNIYKNGDQIATVSDTTNYVDAIYLFPRDASNAIVVFSPHESTGNASSGWGLAMQGHNADSAES